MFWINQLVICAFLAAVVVTGKTGPVEQDSQNQLDVHWGQNSAQKLPVAGMYGASKGTRSALCLENDTHCYAGMVAFSVASETEFGPNAAESTVPFEVIETNIGGGFQSETSHFIAPMAGLYYFQFTLRASADTQAIFAILKLNGQSKAGISTTQGAVFTHTSTNAVILDLDTGDDVHVMLGVDMKVYSDGAHYASFSGYLIQQAI